MVCKSTPIHLACKCWHHVSTYDSSHKHESNLVLQHDCFPAPASSLITFNNSRLQSPLAGSCEYSLAAMISWLKISVHRGVSVTCVPVTMFIDWIYNCFLNNIANICMPKLLNMMAWVQDHGHLRVRKEALQISVLVDLYVVDTDT